MAAPGNMTDVMARLQHLESLFNQTNPTSYNGLNTGDNAWMMIATALVYMMTPGLAFFYGGMEQAKNLLGTFSLSLMCMGIVTTQWALFGYALAFGPRGHVTQLGGGDRSWFALDFGYITNSFYDPTYPLYTHATFECAFAVITPALITGVVVNKMKVSAFCIFVFFWTTLVYDVIAFWVWNPQGWLHAYGVLDFAGGIVIHTSAGFSALVCLMFLESKGREVQQPATQNAYMTVLGGGLLWFGWMGFNAGSASNAGYVASVALINTNVSAGSALLTFVALEKLVEGKVSAVGGIIGGVIGLVIITPSAGYVRPGWAMLIGVWGCILLYGCVFLKRKLTRLDDPLDVFSCHGMGGVFGSLLTGLFSEQFINPAGANGAFYGNGALFWYQLAAVLVTIAYSSAITAILCAILHFTIGLRVSQEEWEAGMDQKMTGEPKKQPMTTAGQQPANQAANVEMGASDPLVFRDRPRPA